MFWEVLVPTKWMIVRPAPSFLQIKLAKLTTLLSTVWERRHLHHSEAISKSIDAALDVSGLSTSDIDCYDFYS